MPEQAVKFVMDAESTEIVGDEQLAVTITGIVLLVGVEA